MTKLSFSIMALLILLPLASRAGEKVNYDDPNLKMDRSSFVSETTSACIKDDKHANLADGCLAGNYSKKTIVQGDVPETYLVDVQPASTQSERAPSSSQSAAIK